MTVYKFNRYSNSIESAEALRFTEQFVVFPTQSTYRKVKERREAITDGQYSKWTTDRSEALSAGAKFHREHVAQCETNLARAKSNSAAFEAIREVA